MFTSWVPQLLVNGNGVRAANNIALILDDLIPEIFLPLPAADILIDFYFEDVCGWPN